jgi:4,5-dihydroxyphthalate decarboxylase
MALHLKFMTGSNPRLAPLREGLVKPENIDLEFTEPAGGSFNLFQYNLHYDDLEASEMSISESLIVRERREKFGNGRWDWAYIPVFLGRGLNWDRLFVRADSEIKSAADLKGKKVAINEYGMTSMVWFRALLKDLFGIEATDIKWFNLRDRGKETGLDIDPPVGIDLAWLPLDADAMGMLERGELDAVHGLGGAANNPKVRSLFPEGARELAVAHYQKAGVHHANHHYVVQRRILKENPWVARSLYDAFEKSRQIAIERAGKDSPAYLYFDGMSAAEQDAIFGPDPYPSGIKANRATIERILRAEHEQGLIKTPVKVEEFYAEGTLDT